MPIADSNPAAVLTFDAAVHRALARRRADTPLPPSRPAPPSVPAATPESAVAIPACD